MQVYSARDVHACLPWGPLVAALEQAHRAPATVPLRHAHALSAQDTLLLMPAWNERLVITKIVTVMPAAPHTVQASVLVLDRATGAPLAWLDGEAVTLRRTAATSALAARHLARPDARRLLLVGTGRLAPWMARAHAALRPGLQWLDVWGRDAAAAQALAIALQAETDAAPPAAGRLQVQAVADLAAAAGQADIICCATTSQQPLVHGAWLRPGVHLDLVGGFRPDMREADDAAMARARIVVDGPGALAEAGDLLQAQAAGRLPPGSILGDLQGLLQGHLATASAPASDRDISVFKSVGSALQDLAAVQAVLLSRCGAAPG